MLLPKIANEEFRIFSGLVWLLCCSSSQQIKTSDFALQYIGMVSSNEAVFLKNITTDLPLSKINIFYRWSKNATSSSSRNLSLFRQMFLPTSVINILLLEHLEDMPYLCVRVDSSWSKEMCKSFEKNNFLNLPAPKDVHIVSVDYNYSLLWNYPAFLLKEIDFVVEVSDDVFEEWKTAKDCRKIHSLHCDLFLNHFDADGKCPEPVAVNLVNARVKPCLAVRQDACGAAVDEMNFDLSADNKISPPDFEILGFENSHLQIRNYPHIVAHSNNLLSCYIDEGLVYNIEYGQNHHVEEIKKFSDFSVENITLKVDYKPDNNTLMCVKMNIGFTYSFGTSNWNKHCHKIIFKKTKDHNSDDSSFYAILFSCLLFAILLLIYVFRKGWRFYKSTNVEIPEELENIKKEIEMNAGNFCTNLVNHGNDSGAEEIIDPLLSYEWPTTARELKPSKKDKKRNESEKTAMFVDDATTDGIYESENSSNLNDSDSASYVCQAVNGEFINVTKSSSHIFNQTNEESFTTAYVFQVNQMDEYADHIVATATETQTEKTNGNNFEASKRNSSQNSLLTQSSNVQIVAKHHPPSSTPILTEKTKLDNLPKQTSTAEDKASSNFELLNESNICNITKLENPTYNISSESNIDLSKTTLHYVKEKVLKENMARSIPSPSCSHCKFDIISTVAISPDKESRPKTNLSLPSSQSQKHTTSPILSSTCLCRNRVFRSNKINPASVISLKESPTRTSSISKVAERSNDYSEPPYVTYERSRADSYRSADSGLPHDCFLSDDSVSPPLSPSDSYVTSHSRQILRFFGQKQSCGEESSSTPYSKKANAMERESKVRFSIELPAILSETEEKPFSKEKNFSDDGRCEDVCVVTIDSHKHTNANYIKITDLCKFH